MKKTVTPLDCEQPFKLNELFFSTTDLRGVITAGNQVFVDISKYSVEELLGAPHNIIRHPEMPRAVFRLLWRYLEANKIIVAYVKNMAANGNYYWVLALVYPLEDGYISIRFKPSSKYFSVVQNLYTEMKEIEKRVGDKGDEKAKGMDESTDFLIEKLCTLGFASYDEFMTEVLKEELSSRDRMLKKEDLSLLPTIASDLINSSVYGNNFMLVSELFTIYLNFYSSNTKLNDFFDKIEVFNQLNSQITLKADNIFDLAKDFRFISLNTAIQSEKLGNNSNTLSVVAS
nr:PAS domain-containing protein [Pseudomonadota bacterium]